MSCYKIHSFVFIFKHTNMYALVWTIASEMLYSAAICCRSDTLQRAAQSVEKLTNGAIFWLEIESPPDFKIQLD